MSWLDKVPNRVTTQPNIERLRGIGDMMEFVWGGLQEVPHGIQAMSGDLAKLVSDSTKDRARTCLGRGRTR